MDELEALRQLTAEKRRALGLNVDGTRPAGMNPVDAAAGGSNRGELRMQQPAGGSSPSTGMGDRAPWTCPTCVTHYAGVTLDVPGLGRRRIPPPPQGQCPECEVRAHKDMEEEQKRKENRRTAELFLKWSDIGPSYLVCTFETFEPRRGATVAFQEARRFVEQFDDGSGRWLLLYGAPGNGKTHLGMAIRGEIERQYVCQAIAVTQPFLMNQIRASWNRRPGDDPDGRSEEWMLSRLMQARFVLWDDLMGWQDWAEERMFAILDSRYRNNRRMVFTSNHSADELEEILGGRLWSRFASRVVMVPVTASDYRLEVERPRVVEGR